MLVTAPATSTASSIMSSPHLSATRDHPRIEANAKATLGQRQRHVGDDVFAGVCRQRAPGRRYTQRHMRLQLHGAPDEQPMLNCPRGKCGARHKAKFAEDVADMPVGCPVRDDKRLSDLPIGESPRDEYGHFPLARSQGHSVAAASGANAAEA